MREIVASTAVAKLVLAASIVPVTAFAIACALGKIDWNDRLLRLFVLMTAMVIAFNLAVYRMPGAGGSYMVPAMVPLGYILGRSLESLHDSLAYRGPAVLALLILLLLHAALNLPPATRALLPDVYRTIADKIAPVLRPDELVLLDDEAQTRAVPYLLGRHDRYGYLFYMDPRSAERRLRQDGSGRVAALIFHERSMTQLTTEKWSAVAALVEQKFVRVMQIGVNPPVVVYLRHDAQIRSRFQH
jgi:hypothetical protein